MKCQKRGPIGRNLKQRRFNIKTRKGQFCSWVAPGEARAGATTLVGTSMGVKLVHKSPPVGKLSPRGGNPGATPGFGNFTHWLKFHHPTITRSSTVFPSFCRTQNVFPFKFVNPLRRKQRNLLKGRSSSQINIWLHNFLYRCEKERIRGPLFMLFRS